MKDELRLKWATWLRENENLRVNGQMATSEPPGSPVPTRYCAVGVLGMLAGVSIYDMRCYGSSRISEEVSEVVGESEDWVEISHIMGHNDSHMKWAYLADKIEEKLPKTPDYPPKEEGQNGASYHAGSDSGHGTAEVGNDEDVSAAGQDEARDKEGVGVLVA